VDGGDHCCISINGGSMDELSFWDQWALLKVIAFGMRFTRFDVYLDFKNRPGLIDLIRDARQKGDFVGARVSGEKFEYTRGKNGEVATMRMVVFGKRGDSGSGRYLRAYDKGLERKTHGPGEYERIEVEFSGDHATEAARTFQQNPTAATAAGLVLGCIEFRENNGKRHRAKRPFLWWYEEIRKGVDCVQVKVAKVAANLVGLARHWQKTVAPKLYQFATMTGQSIESVFMMLVGPLGSIRPPKRNSQALRQFLQIFETGEVPPGLPGLDDSEGCPI